LHFSPHMFAQERQGISDEEIAKLASRAMKQFDVPGMGIGIVKGNETIYAQGFGIRETGLPGKVDTATMFKIASNSKAFATSFSSWQDSPKGACSWRNGL
jgi:CubicO group peptidase (beta-lactamase class C family)